MVDGASSFQQFRYVLLPAILPALAIGCLLLFMMETQLYDTIMALTGGGPAQQTEVASIVVRWLGFDSFRTGAASALSWIVFVVVLPVGIAFQVLARRHSED